MDALYAGIDDTIFIAEKEDLGFETEDENKVTELKMKTRLLNSLDG